MEVAGGLRRGVLGVVGFGAWGEVIQWEGRSLYQGEVRGKGGGFSRGRALVRGRVLRGGTFGNRGLEVLGADGCAGGWGCGVGA